MATLVNDNTRIAAPKAPDSRTGKIVGGSTVPYASVAEANASIIYRFKGLTVLVDVSGVTTEYWYKAGITDGDLIVKTVASSGGGTGGFTGNA